MEVSIFPKKLSGNIPAISSKSQAHRLLICAAFSDSKTTLYCPETNRDMDATADCLRSLGAQIQHTPTGYTIMPVTKIPESVELHCHESGSTLRFMLPVVGALGIKATFLMEGRLPQRPLSPLWEEMQRMGCRLSRPTADTLCCEGRLQPGLYCIDGSVSSQFITGLLLSFPFIGERCTLRITGKLESKPYVDMTLQALRLFGVDADGFSVSAHSHFHSPGAVCVEGDWSNAAFFLAAQAMGSPVTVSGLQAESLQGDKAIVDLLTAMQEHIVVDAADIPDLVPILSIVAAYKQGAVFQNIRRLRLKESDRVASVVSMLHQLGCNAYATENTLHIEPGSLRGGTVNACSDHRIAMSAAIAATVAQGPVTILGAECVSKSYPGFWDDYRKAGGCCEQHIR